MLGDASLLLPPLAASSGSAAIDPVPAAPRDPLVADLLNRVLPADVLPMGGVSTAPWLWQGYLAPGKVTLLTSQWKAGKTTLISVLLSRLQQGGQLAGLSVAAGKALVVSEESEGDWHERCRKVGIGAHASFLCRPFKSKPSMPEWLALVEALGVLRAQQGIDLVVLDTLAAFLPGHSESSAAAMLECLMPLQGLTSAGVSVLLPHHPAKGKTLPGQAARGSGALSGFVDILMEMTWFSHPNDADRRRRLRGYSRHEQTPRHLVIEWTADGSDYVALPEESQADLPDDWQGVMVVLETATAKLTRQDILDNWPEAHEKPDQTTLWRWLTRAVDQGLVRQQGAGRNTDPFRYWLERREPMLHPGEDADKEEVQAWNDRVLRSLMPGLYE